MSKSRLKFQQLIEGLIDKKAVVFDLDDTLYPKSQYDAGAYRDVARLILTDAGADVPGGYEELGGRIERDARAKGPNYPCLFDDVLSWFPRGRVSVADCVKTYHAHAGGGITPDAAVVDGLRTLRDRDVRLGLATNGRRATQETKIRRLNLSEVFDVIYIGDPRDGRYPPKPAIEACRFLVENLGPIDCVIGDSEDVDGKLAEVCHARYVHFIYGAAVSGVRDG